MGLSVIKGEANVSYNISDMLIRHLYTLAPNLTPVCLSSRTRHRASEWVETTAASSTEGVPHPPPHPPWPGQRDPPPVDTKVTDLFDTSDLLLSADHGGLDTSYFWLGSWVNICHTFQWKYSSKCTSYFLSVIMEFI